MFKSLTNINTVFKQMKFFMILVIFLSFGFCVYVWWSSHELVKLSREKIYVLDQGKSLILALSQDINQNKGAEIRNHVERFHQLFFTISPDQKAINDNLAKAFFLADKSAKEQYNKLVESNYYKRFIDSNFYQMIRVDKVEIDTKVYPYIANFFGKMTIIRPQTISERNLITQCQLINVQRTDNNPHGLLMEGWRVINNHTIKEEARENSIE